MTVGPAEIRRAHDRLGERVRFTPVVDVTLAGLPPLTLKLEMMQHTGSFKPRGAFNKALTSSMTKAGLVAASGGNHGLAVAHVAAELGVKAEIFVPSLISAAKLANLHRSKATIIVGGDAYADALAASVQRAEQTGAVMVHAYDDPAVIAGQGTVFWEVEHQVPDVDAVVVAVGGGGFSAGAAAWFGSRVDLIAVETDGTQALHAALVAGTPVPVEVSGLAADSLGARQVGSHPFQLLAPLAISVVITDHDVIAAQEVLWDRLRIAAEPGGAAAFAAVLNGTVDLTAYRRPVVVVCGGNVDPASLNR